MLIREALQDVYNIQQPISLVRYFLNQGQKGFHSIMQLVLRVAKKPQDFFEDDSLGDTDGEGDDGED